MRIIKEILTIYISSKHIEPGSKLGIFISELKSRINKETDFINYISSIKYWDFNKIYLWSFEEVLNYIDEILEKYSTNSNQYINENILKPLIKFTLLLLKNCYNKEIYASFDNLQKIYFTCMDMETKILIIEINLLLVENKHSLVIVNKLFYRTLFILINLRMILLDLIHNNFIMNQGMINILEQMLNKIYKKWILKLQKRRKRLTNEENDLFIEIAPYDLFKEIIEGKKNYKNPDDFKGKLKEEYEYFTKGYVNKTKIYENNLKYENGIKYLLKDEIVYINNMNNFLLVINEIVQCGLNIKENKEKINIISKYILLGLNLFVKDNQINNDDEENSFISENYIQNYYNDILKIVTSPTISFDLKGTFLNSCTYFMVTFEGYDNILFQNGLFNSFLNDLTHQNGNEMEVLTIEQEKEQEFLNIILNFVFNFKIFKEIPQNLLAKILEVPNNKIYPYRIDNVVFALKKRKAFDEKIIKNILLPRLIYELENLEIPSDELKYKYNNDIKITINQRNNLIDKLFRVLIKIVKKSSSLNQFGNFDLILEGVFKKIIANKNIVENIEYIPSVINFIYFFIKLCNCFPSKIPTYINNNIFDLIMTYFQNYLPKYDGALHLLFLMLYTICIHNDGKAHLKKNIEKIEILFKTIFEKIEKNSNYFYYNLFVLKDLNKYELYSPLNALIHTEGISEIIKIIFDNLQKFIEKIKQEVINTTIKKADNIILDEKLFFVEAKRSFIDEYFISFSEKEIEFFQNNLKIDIIPILKLYLDVILNTTSLYSLSSHFVIIKPITALAKKYPEYVMDKLYDKLKEILDNNNNKLDIEEIQFSKIISTLQKIFEEIFSKIYQKIENVEFINKLDKYTLLLAKYSMKIIASKKNLTSYISPINDRQLIVNNKYYVKFISNKIEPQFRDLLIKISYKILYKFAPHTTNPKLLIIDEDNFQDIKCPVEENSNINLEVVSNSFFFMELLKTENKINNYLLTSVEYFHSLGKITKSKDLNEINLQDISRIKNYIKLGYLLSNIIKQFEKIYDINPGLDSNVNITNILILLSLFNYINILMYGKMEVNISSIVLFYFIKYGGVRHLFKISKKLLYFCKSEYAKKDLPITELLIIKNFWNIQASILLLLIKFLFNTNHNFYTLMILEHDLVQNFDSLKELDAYIKYTILSDFYEIFFDKNDNEKNSEVIKDIELYSIELSRVVYILFDNCVNYYSKILDISKEKINPRELFNKGYNIYEITQVIQEGEKNKKNKINNENIMKIIDELRINEKALNDKNKEDKEKDKDKGKEPNNNILDINSFKDSPVNNINFERKNKKTINKYLLNLEQIKFQEETSFINEIDNIFPENITKDINLSKSKDINTYKNDSYTRDNFLNSLNNLYDILDRCSLSNQQIYDMKKMNIKYRIKFFERNKDLLSYMEEIFNIIKKVREERNKNNDINKEEILKKELKYIKFLNYSILRYKKLTDNFYETVDINKYMNFIYDHNIIENSAKSIKELIKNKNDINTDLIKKLIYEHFLSIFHLFLFLEQGNKDFLKEKNIFLEAFLFLLKESNTIKNKFIFNEAIIIMGLQTIIQYFNNNDKSQEMFEEYLIKKDLFKYLLALKFNPEDANLNFYENKFRYFITLEESFKQFILKIISEKNAISHLLESVFRYAFANINPENNEIDLQNFVILCSDYLKDDNKDIFINSIKKMFDIIINKSNFYILKLKPQFEKEVEKIKEEIYKGDINQNQTKKKILDNKINDNKEIISSKNSSDKEKINIKEKIENIKDIWSEQNKILFNMLLDHICNTSKLINKDIEKQEKYQKFKRNYLFDLDTSLIGLNCILKVYPSYIYLLHQYNCGDENKINFIKYLFNQIFPILNHYHYCIAWPEYVCHKEDLENNVIKEKQDILRQYNNKANSFQSIMENFRNNNIIVSLIHSISYKRRNMNDNEISLINQTRLMILKEINTILNDIVKDSNDLNDFDFLLQNNELYPKNVVLFKSCILILFAMSEYIENSDIYDQFNPLEIANLIYNKDFNIITNITFILKNMKFEGRNAIFHEMGIKCLNKLFRYIDINKKKKGESNKDKKMEEDIENDIDNINKNKDVKNDKNKGEKNDQPNSMELEIEEEINIRNSNNINENNNMDDEEDIIMEHEEDFSEQNERRYSIHSLSDQEVSIRREEEYYEEGDDMNHENILEENNVEEGDLLDLMGSEENEEDEDSNEGLNELDNPNDLNNFNMRIIQNENNTEMEEVEQSYSSGERLYNNLDRIERENSRRRREENILFYEHYTTSLRNNNNKSNSETLKLYEEFIVFPFLIFGRCSENNLGCFYLPKINVDLFCNENESIVERTKSFFLYYYLFPFYLKYDKYLDFVLIGLKNKTIKAYFTEMDNIIKHFSVKLYSSNEKITNICDDICNRLKEDKSVIKQKKEIIKEGKDKEKDKDSKINEKMKDDNKLKEKEKEKDVNKNNLDSKEDKDNLNAQNKEKEEESKSNLDNNNNNNNNSNLLFLLELPSDLREDILYELDPNAAENLTPELRAEYERINNRNQILPLMPFNMILPINTNSEEIRIHKKKFELKKLNYNKKNLLSIFNENNNQTYLKNEDNNITNIFDDDFLENMILYYLKSILIFKAIEKKEFAEYGMLLKKLIHNEILRYKIIDIIINLWIYDSSYLFNLIKNEKYPQNNNSFLEKLYYIYINLGLTEDYFFYSYENLFTNFTTKYQKYMKKYFLKTSFNEKGEYIHMGNIYNITENSKNLKSLMNFEYKTNENVLSNLINLTLINSNVGAFKICFTIKIFTIIIQNCLNDTNNKETDININNELGISSETIEKILNLFNNFEVTYSLVKEKRSNNPTSLLNELLNDRKIFQIILNVLQKKIKSLKEKITKEMDDFTKEKKIADISIFNKMLPEIYLFKLVKYISNINEYFNEQISDSKKNTSVKKEMHKELKHFIRIINDMLFSCWKQLNNLLLNINTSLKENKENQDSIFPKLNNLIPYLDTFITLSHLQFISTNSPILNSENNPFIFEKKFEANTQSPIHMSPPNVQSMSLIRLNSKNEIDSFVEFFYEFCENNKKIINFILRQYPKMFTNELIRKISSLLDLENKRKYFSHSLKKLPSNKRYFQIHVRRNGAQLFSDSFESLYKRNAKDLRGQLLVHFENEEAIDAGGVKREWLTLLTKEMFNPNYMLFTLAKNGTTYTINSDSGKYNPDHLKYFEFIGKIMAKAIFDGMMIDCYFTRIIYKLICGTPISYHDMEDYDPVYYNSIKWLLEKDFTETETSLTYSYNHDNLGEIQTVDLIENGRNIDVTEANKFDYVQRLCSSKLYDTIKLQIDALLKGFYDIIPQNLISIFNHRELELVISGMPKIDINDWKNNTIYENYTEISDVIKNFWEIIESFDNDERAEFLQFVTGSAKVPLEGFCALQGIGGINKFKISKVFDKNFERLPTAHTCTNQLDLPEYPNKEILNDRLRLAIKEGKNSFGFI